MKKLLCVVLISFISLTGISVAVAKGAADVSAAPLAHTPFFETSYLQYLNAYNFNGILASDIIEINVDEYEAEGRFISWEFNVPMAGFYNLEVTYMPIAATNSAIIRAITLNGERLHEGLRQIAFHRFWQDDSENIVTINNNEVRPRTHEVFSLRTVFVSDSQRRDTNPYIFFLNQGRNVLTFETIREPMYIESLRFLAAPIVPSYEQYAQRFLAYPVYTGANLVFQAERIIDGTLGIQKSATSINMQSAFFDPSLVPFHPYRITFNTIGGDSWRLPGEIIKWRIYVPETGLYALSFRGRQSGNRGTTSYRRLTINGQVPFLEAERISFGFSSHMNNYVIDGDEPYLFFLNAGENEIALEVVLGNFGMAFAEISYSVRVLNDLSRRVTQITGVSPDRFIDYRIPEVIPDFEEILENEYNRLQNVMYELYRLIGDRGENNTLIERMIFQLNGLLQRPDNITQELSQFINNISMLATWLLNVSEMPLELDSFTLFSPYSEPYPARAGFFRRLANVFRRFLATFFVNMDAVDMDFTLADGGTPLRVWKPTGRDQAQVLGPLIDEIFIPTYQVSTIMELIPVDVVVPATLAGEGPDVVISLDQQRLLDFAVRNALVPLSDFEGFEQEASRFFPSALEGITFRGNIYGLPETQVFSIMFYRTDILDELGITPPETWEELQDIIPILHRHNYEMFIDGIGPFGSMLVQRSGDLYLGEGNDYGIKSGLHSQEAMDAFTELTTLFTAFRLPVAMNFANRFRTGETPIGIADYTLYHTLNIFAPEIRGLWSFALMPGTLQEDGSIDNTVLTSTTQTVMMSAAENRGMTEAAWQFIRWWLSDDIQTEYAMGIESILGAAARYPTANPNVLRQLLWTEYQQDLLLRQFENTRGIPAVPGHYMTGRMLTYTFHDVVANHRNPRELLFFNVRAINDELTRKRQEFNLSYWDAERSVIVSND